MELGADRRIWRGATWCRPGWRGIAVCREVAACRPSPRKGRVSHCCASWPGGTVSSRSVELRKSETGLRLRPSSKKATPVHPHPCPTSAGAQGGTRMRKVDGRPRPGSAGKQLAGARAFEKVKRTALRESPFMRSLGGLWMLHHHSSRRKARAETALCRRPVDCGALPSPKGTE